MKTILVTGGAGYVGSTLVPRLLNAGYRVKVLDWYCFKEDVFNPLRSHRGLAEHKGDIRDQALLKKILPECDTVIHLACLSNDPSVELDPALSRSVNYDSFRPLVKICKKSGVKRFIFASSSSVYGVSDASDITEDHPHLPVTDYNRYKSLCESILWEEQAPGFSVVVIRPATICGYAPRLRLDLTVNLLTNHAVNLDRITVFGGSQMRPNLHIEDILDLYLLLLELPDEKIAGKVFNAGYENRTVSDLAGIVRRVVEREMPGKKIMIATTSSDDIRSYHISSEKIKRELGFVPKRTIEDAVSDLVRAFKAGNIPNPLQDPHYYNVETMKEKMLKGDLCLI